MASILGERWVNILVLYHVYHPHLQLQQQVIDNCGLL